MGQKNMICRRIFLPYKIAPVSVRKSSIYITFYYEKRLQKYFMYWLLRQINFFFPTRGSIGILIMDFEGIFDVEGAPKKSRLAQNVAINKKSTIVVQSL